MSQTLSTKLQRIAERAAQDKEMAFSRLSVLIRDDLLREAHRRTRKDAAPGVDGQTGKAYEAHLEENLRDLYDRLRGQRYKAPPVRRVRIPKDGGGQRALGITAYEDKVVQRAVVMLLEPMYEQDFYDISYGYRPRKSAHQALARLRAESVAIQGGWIIDADISGYFDTIDHGILRELLKKRVNDGGIIRLIGKWLNAGVLDGNELHYPDTGTPQGSVISPLLANIYLHYVLDEWFIEVVQPRLRGRGFLIRFADDVIIGCEREDDARRVMDVLPKRLGKYGLSINTRKTRQVNFQRPRSGEKGGGTFDFLGFTHYWCKSRAGYWVIKRKTAKQRLSRAIRSLALWCRRNRHLPLPVQHKTLSQKLRGHYQYYGVRCNSDSLAGVRHHTVRAWHKWLNRRGAKRRLTWEKFERLLDIFPLPQPVLVHRSV
jgi:group II intron reverse transcriptase/maturase